MCCRETFDTLFPSYSPCYSFFLSFCCCFRVRGFSLEKPLAKLLLLLLLLDDVYMVYMPIMATQKEIPVAKRPLCKLGWEERWRVGNFIL